MPNPTDVARRNERERRKRGKYTNEISHRTLAHFKGRYYQQFPRAEYGLTEGIRLYLEKDLRDPVWKLSINGRREREREGKVYIVCNMNVYAEGVCMREKERKRDILFSGDCKTVDYPSKAEV